MMEKDKFAVFGNPIKQSKSPIIHTLFAQQYAQHIEYRAVRVELDDFVQATSRFFEGVIPKLAKTIKKLFNTIITIIVILNIL